MSDEDIAKTAALLGQLEPGFLPYPIFEQIARLVALPIIEFIPLRIRGDGKVEVLLINRGPDDPLWPGVLHTPGTVIRATDIHQGSGGNWQAFSRIIDDELRGTKLGPPQYVGSMFHASKRGVEQAQLYWLEVLDDPVVGAMYDTGNLPSQTMESQRDFISQAVANFRSVKNIA